MKKSGRFAGDTPCRCNMIGNYLRLVKFSHTLFAMPFALASFFMALQETENPLSWRLLVLVVAAMVFARNAAMAFNRYIDREIDRKNPRTLKREIPAGILRARAVLVFVALNSLLFMGAAFMINPLCFALSPVALAVILGYSLTKRFTALCHLILGVGLSLAPLGAWLAVTGTFHPVPVLLSFSVLFWVSGFDIIYALQDEEFDKDSRLHSIPATIGKKRSLQVSSLLHAASFGFLVAVTILSGAGKTGIIGTSLFGLLLLYQHLIISPRDLSRVNISFFTTNGIASLLWATLFITGILTGT
ncbi:MAG TPA: UbiA-like polyprenyltransferase [Bacteroidales bacterium]|nr:UbiA-like polyprenyltransferase [Bacteroidales bacterium]HRZ48715.1 UbiA-like polyprenyltransferase [Bacteroidales bacterium]